MSDDAYPARGAKNEKRHKSFFERLAGMFEAEPETQEQLLEILHGAHERDLLDDDALSIIEGTLQISTLRARDIMVPRAQMDGINIEDTPREFIPNIIATSHSRFPVFEGGRDKVIGVLLAKDLLRFYHNEDEFDVRDNLRPAVFVPESKPLNVLLREFRENRNHMAIVVDEFGAISGLVTIEDILEQIVGDIEDEFDEEDVADVRQLSRHTYAVRALTDIDDFNQRFKTDFADEEVDTIGGVVMQAFGYLPKRGEEIALDEINFKVTSADSRRIIQLRVTVNDERLAEMEKEAEENPPE